MKKILNLLIILGFITLVSCEKASEGLTRITYYAEIELEGDVVAIPVGGTYTEPGYVATENGVDISDKVETSNDVDPSSVGIYSADYAVKNADGYYTIISRVVVVYDPSSPSDDFSGSYTTAIVRTESDGSVPRNYAANNSITKLANGVFYVDCLLGGTYSIGFNYGSAYAMTGYLLLNSDYTLTLISSYVAGWGNGLEGFQNGVYDTATGLPYWESIYAGGDIYAITMSK
jgi:hypothetical protein